MLSDQLTTLETADLIRRGQTQPELEYLFRHALVQDAAYRSLLRNQRRELHLAVGLLLEKRAGAHAAEYAALLAHHFLEAGDDQRALNYLDMAGDAAARKHANAEAILHYGRALDIALRGGDAAGALATTLFVRRGRAYELSGDYDRALANYAAMAQHARAAGNRAGELSATLSTATLFAVPNPVYDPARAEALVLQVVADARALAERATECRALWVLMVLCIYSSRDPKLAVSYGEQSLVLARALDLREQLAYILTDLYLAYFAAGKMAAALPALTEARALWQALANMPMLADALSRTAHYYFCTGDMGGCMATSTEALQVSRAAHNLWQEANSRQIAASAYLEQGRVGEAMVIVREMLVAADEGGVVPSQVGGRAVMGYTLAWLGDVPAGLKLAEAAIRSAEHVPPMRAWALAAMVRIRLVVGDVAAAAAAAHDLRDGYTYLRGGLSVLVPAWVDIALAIAELALARGESVYALEVLDELQHSLITLGVRPYVYDALYLKAMARTQLGQHEAAIALLSEARLAAEAIGAHRALWHINSLLGAAQCRLSRPEEGRAAYAEARAHIEFIADGLPADALRQSFMQSPAVRAVLDNL